MAFNDTYRESIQSKHLSNVGFTSTAKGVTNEAYALKNPHQVLAAQVPVTDVVTEYGALTASGIAAGKVEEHVVKLTADPTVNGNKAWVAYEDNCTTAGHSARGHIRLDQWMRYAETQYKLRLFEDNGTGTGYDSNKEILPSETSFNWEYDASAGVVYFDEDPSSNGKTLPLWGVFYKYVGDSVADQLASISGTVGAHDHDDRYYTKTQLDNGQLDNRYYTETEVDSMLATTSGSLQTQIDNTYTQAEVDAKDTAISGSLQNDIIWEETWSGVIQPKAGQYWGDPIYTPGNMTIGGDLVVSGTRFISNTETVEIEDNLLVINAGEQGAGVTEGQAGIQVDRGTSPDYFFLYDENQDNFRVGVSGTLQAVATREDTPGALRVPWWNDTDYRFDTNGSSYITVDTTSDVVAAYAASTKLFSIASTAQSIGDTAAGGTNVALSQSNDTVVVTASGVTSATFGKSGVALASGATVNDIATAIVYPGDDTTLSTEKAIVDYVDTVSGTLSQGTDNLDIYKYITDGLFTAEASGNTDTFTISGTGGTTVTITAASDLLTIDSFDAFLDLTDTPGAYTANNTLYMTAAGLASNSTVTYDPNNSEFNVGGVFSLATGTTVNEIVSTVDSSSTDDQLATAGSVFDLVNAVSGTLSDATTALDFYKYITDGTNTAEANGNDDTITFAATGGATVTITAGTDTVTIDAFDTFLELTDTPSAYTANNMLYMTGSAVADTSAMTYNPTTSGVAFAHDVSIGGDLSLAAGTSVNEIATSIGSNTDDQLITAKAVEDYVDGQMNLVDAYKFVTNGTDTTTASGLDTLTINGVNGLGVSIDATTDTVTISGAGQPTSYEAELTYNAGGGYWAYNGGFSSVPSDLEVFLNGVKNKKDADYYTSTVVGGELRITFAFDTYAEDWANITYGTIWNGANWVNITASANISSGQRILVDTSSASAYTLTLPSSPTMGDEIHFLDGGYNCGTVHVTLARNGNNIMGLAQNMDIDTDGAAFKLVYYNTTRGWVIY
jgi:hypothetical protein